ncbi:MAG TPA: hypothetical protein VJQ45_04110 [Ktedonobacterales bacterium]|nr:hypothetical protein [Ktedonobacterales bacterium]
MKNSTDPAQQAATPGKKPLNQHLLSGARGTVDDVRVQSGYPIWNLIAAWMSAGYRDDEVLSGYGISREEWDAAKSYYFDHKPIIDARIIANSQPAADDDVPPMRTVEEYFTWLLHNSSETGRDEVVSNG